MRKVRRGVRGFTRAAALVVLLGAGLVALVVLGSPSSPGPAGVDAALNGFGEPTGSAAVESAAGAVIDLADGSESAPAVALAPGDEYWATTAAHVSGAAGTNWRTDLEVHNPGGVQASYTIYLLKRDTNNASPQQASYSLGTGQAARYNDLFSTIFGYNGGGALRVVCTGGTIMVTSRTYNDQPGGTFGQFVRGRPLGEGIAYGEAGRMIQLTHNRDTSSGYRTNLLFVNATASTLQFVADFYAASGAYLGQQQRTLSPYEYKQIDKAFEAVTGGDVADGYIVVSTTTPGGRFFAGCSVIDNRTGDAVFVPHERTTGGGTTTTTAGSTTTTAGSTTTTVFTTTTSAGSSTTTTSINAGTGTLAFRLLWNDTNDLDLHVIEPNGTHIYFNNKGPTATNGRLDVDCNAGCDPPDMCGTPTENVFWASAAPNGTYTFWIDWWQTCGPASSNFTLYVYVNGVIVRTITGTLYGTDSEQYTHMQGGGSTTTTAGSTTTTSTGGGVNLGMFTPSDWPSCVVVNYRNVYPPVNEFLSIYYTTYVYWAVSNSGSTSISSTPRFGIYIDGTQVSAATCPSCVPWGAGVSKWFVSQRSEITTAGNHTVTVRVDPYNELGESNESDNDCSTTGNWTTIVLSAQSNSSSLVSRNVPTFPLLRTLAEPQVGKRLLPSPEVGFVELQGFPFDPNK